MPEDLVEVPRRAKDFSGVQGSEKANVFSVDVEEWFQVGAFEHSLARENWHALESRVEYQTDNILALLQTRGISATFFCLGWVAERNPGLIRKIAAAGHEIGCHGMDHRRIFTLTEQEFADDIRLAKELLEDAAGVAVKGYRAPSFSMRKDIWHYYQSLVAAGFAYSSSIVPAVTDHYGMSGVPRAPFYPLKGQSFVEVPMTVARVMGRTFPASGGGYFRLLPAFLSRALMRRAARQTGIGTIFYMHPWETDPGQPLVTNAPPLSKFRHYTGQAKMLAKLDTLLSNAPFMRLDEFLDREFEIGPAP